MKIPGLRNQIQNEELRDITFDECSALLGERGFRFDKERDGFWVFVHPTVPGNLGVQASAGKAELFQVLYLLRMLEKHGLAAEK